VSMPQSKNFGRYGAINIMIPMNGQISPYRPEVTALLSHMTMRITPPTKQLFAGETVVSSQGKHAVWPVRRTPTRSHFSRRCNDEDYQEKGT
jgi:hypothetical protein